jgi:hypothetical protein
MRIHRSPGVPERRKTLVEYDQWHPEMFTSATRPQNGAVLQLSEL